MRSGSLSPGIQDDKNRGEKRRGKPELSPPRLTFNKRKEIVLMGAIQMQHDK